MTQYRFTFGLGLVLLAGLGLLSGCAGSDAGSDEEFAEEQETIFNGTAASTSIRKHVTMHTNGQPGQCGFVCSATLITNQWALTAKHCVATFDQNGNVVSALAGPEVMFGYDTAGGRVWRQGEQAFHHPIPSVDVSLFRLSSKFTFGSSSTSHNNTLTTLSDASLVGQNLSCHGYGSNRYEPPGTDVCGNTWSQPYAAGFDTLRHATLTVSGASNGYVTVVPNAQQQQLFFGDSGTSCFKTFSGGAHLVGDLAWGQTSPPNPPPVEGLQSANVYRDWFHQTMTKYGESLAGWTPSRAAVSFRSNPSNQTRAVEVFVRGTDNQVWTRSASVDPLSEPEVGTWSAWNALGGITSFAPAATNRNTADQEMFVFVRATDDSLQYKRRSNGTWPSSWSALGGILASAPTAAVDAGTSDVWVFVRNTSSRVSYRKLTGSWGGWTEIPDGSFSAHEPAAAITSDSVWVFMRNTGGTISYNRLDKSTGVWSGWTSLGGSTPSAVSAASTAEGRIDLYVRNSNNQLAYRTYYGTAWGPWVNPVATTPTLTQGPAVSARGNTVDIVTVGTNGLVERLQSPW